jgi:hypothetical protein
LKKRKNFYKGAIMRFISKLSFFAFPKGRVLLGFLAVLLTFPACQNPTGDSSPAEKSLDHLEVEYRNGSTQLNYRVGQSFKYDLTVYAVDTGGSRTAITGYTTNFDSSEPLENKPFKVFYGGLEKAFEVNIMPLTFESSDNEFDAPLTVLVYGNNSWKGMSSVSINSESGSNFSFETADITNISVNNSGSSSHKVWDAAFGQGKFVAVGGTNATSIYVFNNNQWAPYNPTLPTEFDPTQFGYYQGPELHAVTYGNNRFVAVGHNGLIVRSSPVTSSASLRWEAEINIPPFGVDTNINCIVYGDKFVIGGPGGKMAYSSDGLQWTDCSWGGGNIKGFAYGQEGGRTDRGNIYVMIIQMGSIDMIAYTTDITRRNWQIAPTLQNPAFQDVTFNALAYGDGLFVAVGDEGKYAYSVDGETWTIKTLSDFGKINAIAYGNDQFVIVGGDSAGKIAISN